MVFSIESQPKILVCNINDAVAAGFSMNVRKLKIPKKVVVNDIKSHPFEPKFVAACSDGLVIC